MDTPTLSIGGLQYVLHLPPGCLLERYNPLYDGFFSTVGNHGPVIDVRITLDPEPDLAGLARVFRTTDSWSAYRLEGGLLLRLPDPVGNGNSAWSLLIPDGDSPPVIHCGRRMIRRRSGEEILRLVNPIHYPVDQLLSMFYLSRCPGVIIHAAGIRRGNRGIVCAGVSGAGKTTLMRQWRDAPNIEGLSDDRIIIRRLFGLHRAFGTPWAGEGRIASPADCRLEALAFIRKSSENSLRPIGPMEAMQQLLPVCSIPYFDRGVLDQILDFCRDLVSDVPTWELSCRPDRSAADLLDRLLPR